MAIGEAFEVATVRLLADSMLGTLGKWLRLLGYDTAVATSYVTDAELVRLARAEGRVILTRDRGLARRRGVQVQLVQAEDLEGQLAEVARALELPPPEPGTRCAECNSLLVAVGRGELADDVPPYVLQTQETFRRCPACGRVYWRGTHWEGMERVIAVWEAAQGEGTS